MRPGITPAYAGNTPFIFLRCEPLWDHPRLRGEHTALGKKKKRRLGSPPPTRGTLGNATKQAISNRITPAYAGNTTIWNDNQFTDKDHPRLRGEHVKNKLFTSLFWGSPPPTRGTRFMTIWVMLMNGITPAYAGNTISDYCFV